MIIFSWILSVVASFLQLFLFVLLASYITGLLSYFEAKIQGSPINNLYPLKNKVGLTFYKTYINFFRDCSITQFCFLFILLMVVIVVGLMIPTFTTGLILSGGADLLLIFVLLILMPVFFFVVDEKKQSLLILKKLPKIVINNFLFLPMFVLLVMVCKLITHHSELNEIALFFHTAGYPLVIALCPLFINACALCFFVLDIPDLINSMAKDGFKKEEQAILLYIYDLQFLAWLSLIAFLLWPQSIAILDLYHGTFITWLMGAFFGILAWVVKITLECLIIALMRNLLFISRGWYKIGIATVLNFLAVIIYFAGLSGT